MDLEIAFAKSKWEARSWPLDEFVRRVRGHGFDAAEIYLPWQREDPAEVGRTCRDGGLELIAHLSTEGFTPDAHRDFLERWFETAATARPTQINFHTGKDHFSFADNVRIFERALDLSRQTDTPVFHETHRGRALFSCHVTPVYLKELPDLQLTADFSHWVCVAESDLRDQSALVDESIARVGYVHARVGHDQGPQVGDPRDPLDAPWLRRFEEFWAAIVQSARERGRRRLYFTPEFGPPPYAAGRASDAAVISRIWEINLWMHGFLKQRFPSQ